MFRRPVASGGLRFILPATPDHHGTLYIVIEPFRESKRELFVEVKGVFAAQHTPLTTPVEWESNIRLCREFISKNLFPFLNQYDTPQDEA
jgi:hypothetical protein